METTQQIIQEIEDKYDRGTASAVVIISKMRIFIEFAERVAKPDMARDVAFAGGAVIGKTVGEMHDIINLIKVDSPEEFYALVQRHIDATLGELQVAGTPTTH
ncbi:hypothetical protein CHELA1G11_10884 [Hyphomicrobiales bacterium]|nr:hypothetical protein CHELA1G11_10884 [Hyphomicrobiales bacterium]CAH1671645.1 hypothetical protein CHELA1G2_13425 [Hyphomicrobiales bacterium]